MSNKNITAPFQLILLTFLLTAFSSCNGQIKTNSQAIATTVAGQTKLVKTQGSKIYDLVRCSLQDKTGNLWFGTTGEGVYRFDGKYFIQYTVKDGLTNNCVWSLVEDNSGNIWIGTDNGICRYDGKTITSVSITVTNYHYLSPTSLTADYSSNSNSGWSMLKDKNGKLWFGLSNGMYCYDGKNFTRFLDDKNIVNDSGLQLKMVERIAEDKNGNLWFCSGMLPGEEGLIKFDGKTLTQYKPDGQQWIRYAVEDAKGNLYVGTRHKGVWKFDGKQFSKFSTNVNGSISAFADKAGNIWFSITEKTKMVLMEMELYCFIMENHLKALQPKTG